MGARQLLASLRAQPDVICVQEHKLRPGRINRIQNEVYARARWLCAPAAEGTHAIRNPLVAAGRGGIAMGISHVLAPYIHSEGITACRRAVWICLVHPQWGRIGFVGVYGPNNSAGRTALWRTLFFDLDPSFRWFLMGDFNMVESATDQWGGIGGPPTRREWGAWSQLLRKLGCHDTFLHKPGHLKFSWDSLRLHRHNPRNSAQPAGHRILRRLDHIYAPGGVGSEVRRYVNYLTWILLLRPCPGLGGIHCR